MIDFSLLTAWIPTALAESLSGTANDVAGALPNACGSNFEAILRCVGVAVLPLLRVIAILLIIIAGFTMIVSQNDDAVSKAKGTLTAVVTGLIMSLLTEPFINAFFGTTGEAVSGGGSAIFSDEVMGLIDWFLTIAGVLAIITIVVSALRALANAGSEEGLSQLRSTVYAVLVGILLVLVKQILAIGFGATGSANAPVLIQEVIKIVSYFLGFAALAALTVIIYAGINLALNLGDEERATKAKQLLLRVFIGFLVLATSFAIVRFVIGSATGAT